MISPKRGSPTFALLQAIAESPDTIGPAEAADIVCPRPRLTGTEGYREWARSVAVARPTPHSRGPVLTLDPARQARASRALRRLAEAGLIEPVGAPRLSDWFTARVALRGLPGALALTSAGESVDLGPVLVGIVERVGGGCATTIGDVLGPKPSGATQAAWRWLVRSGVVVGVYGRRVSAAGLELLNKNKETSK